jgi:hypothetical protein
MSINLTKLTQIIAGCVTSGGIIFNIGRQSERLDTLNFKVEAQEIKGDFNNDKICEIYNNINILQNDVTNIKEDITEIKEYIRIYKK